MKKLLFLYLLFPFIGLSQNHSYVAGGRSNAIAHASIAIEDIWAAHHNQAALAKLDKATLAFSYQNKYLLKDLSLAQAAFAYPLEFGTLGLSLNYFGFELYNESKIGINYSRSFSKYFHFGLQINYQNYYVEQGSSNTAFATFETGILAKPTSKVKLGFHLYNPSGNYKNPETKERTPFIGRLGGLYQFTEKVFLSAEVKKQEMQQEYYAIGFEYQLEKILTLRTGLGLQPVKNTFGLGLNFSDFQMNIAYEYAQILGNNATLSLQYAF